ncbi:hypothetical protein FACS1894153_3070 [Bacteroidia bacterium]|nr:hypothetical protein FACS1894153_3070 [Bacteroidia bacterium]
MNINKIIKFFLVIIILSVFTTNDILAEKNDTINPEEHLSKDEFTIWGGGGLSILHYNPVVGVRNNHLGGLFGLGYIHNFSQHWGIIFGLEASFYRSSLYVSNLSDNYNASDLDPYFANQKFNFRYRINKYEEEQRLWNMNIPIVVQYQTPIWKIHKYFVAVGFKLGIPIDAKYKSTAESIESYGFYPEYNQVLNEPKVLGFGKFDNQTIKGKFDFDLAYIGTIETGVKWDVGNGVNLYTGLFLDYGFNDIVKKHKHDKRFVDYNSYHDGHFTTINSALESQYTTNDNSIGIEFGPYSNHNGDVKPLTSAVRPVSVGIKLRFSFGSSDPNRKKSHKTNDCCCCDCITNNNSKTDYSELEKKLDTLISLEKKRQETSNNSKNPEVKQPLQEKTQEKTNQNSPVVEQAETSTPPANSTKQELAKRREKYIEKASIINYDLNIWSLNAHNKKVMDYYLKIMLSYPNYKLLITGHTCDLGSASLNHKLALKRAEEAKAYLVKNGVKSSRILTYTAGKEDPIVPNDSDSHRKQNRRLEFGIVVGM